MQEHRLAQVKINQRIQCCVYLLDVRGKLGKGLCVGQDGTGGVAQETDIPDGGETQLHRNVLLKRRIPEMRVHIPSTCRR